MMIVEIHVHNQLLTIYNTCTIIKNIDLGKDVRFIFCDISKAFDRVWHSGESDTVYRETGPYISLRLKFSHRELIG
jgi:hypothetical protein